MIVPAASLSLDPALLAQIADLELAARLVVEGARLGSHRSPFTGAGAEFQQMRPYLPGDDLKHLDWKHYARTDRLFTRVYREATEWPVMLALDTSRSMAFADARGVTKLEVARLLAAALAYLLIQQGEAVGAVMQRDTADTSLPARGGRAHLVRLLGTLSRLDADGATDIASGLRRAVARLARRGCIVIISDLYGGEDWHAVLREVRRAGHEAVIFHVFTPGERRLPPGEDTEFEDLETGERLVTHTARIRERYAERFAAFLAEQRAAAQAEGVAYVEAETRRGVDALVREFAAQRASREGAPR